MLTVLRALRSSGERDFKRSGRQWTSTDARAAAPSEKAGDAHAPRIPTHLCGLPRASVDAEISRDARGIATETRRIATAFRTDGRPRTLVDAGRAGDGNRTRMTSLEVPRNTEPADVSGLAWTPTCAFPNRRTCPDVGGRNLSRDARGIGTLRDHAPPTGAFLVAARGTIQPVRRPALVATQARDRQPLHGPRRCRTDVGAFPRRASWHLVPRSHERTPIAVEFRQQRAAEEWDTASDEPTWMALGGINSLFGVLDVIPPHRPARMHT